MEVFFAHFGGGVTSAHNFVLDVLDHNCPLLFLFVVVLAGLSIADHFGDLLIFAQGFEAFIRHAGVHCTFLRAIGSFKSGFLDRAGHL